MPDVDLDRLLSMVLDNQSLREALGWNKKRYDAARDALVEAGKLCADWATETQS